jgi:serpin B
MKHRLGASGRFSPSLLAVLGLGVLLVAVPFILASCGTGTAARTTTLETVYATTSTTLASVPALESGSNASAVLVGKSQAIPSVEAKMDISTVAASSNDFSFELFKAIRSDSENLVYSPYGLSVVLSMTMAGAKGDTQQELSQVLHLGLPESRLYPALGALDSSLAGLNDFTSASALWGQTGRQYEQAFIDLLGETYGAPLRLVDFGNYQAAAKTINDWVSENTKGRIPELVSPDRPRPDIIVLMLTNAVYMKAAWRQPFPHWQTADRPFHLLDGTIIQVPTMGQTGNFSYLSEPALQALELPYSDGRLSLVVLAPAAGHFDDFARDMSAEQLQQALARFKTGELDLEMPRFTFSSSPNVTQALQLLGLKAPFSSQADFSGMITGQSNISAVVQKAFIAVNEEGTEAAATSGVTMAAGDTTTITPPPSLHIDRPFYYLVRDNATGTILFLGQVTDPR